MIASPSYKQNGTSPRSPPPSSPEPNRKQEEPRRRPSFSFLHRSKSVERLTATRSLSGGKLTKKNRIMGRDQEMQTPQQPPKIPDLPRSFQLQTFGGENTRDGSLNNFSSKVQGQHQEGLTPRGLREHTGPNMYNVPIPPIPGTQGNEGYVDPYARSESMTHRGRYSYASSTVSTVNSPRRMRRRKDPTPFNILVIGACGSGKSSFLNFLRTSLALPPRKQRPQLHEDMFRTGPISPARTFPNFTSHYLETEIENERIGLTLWDSQGLDANIVDLQLREMSSFLESKFEDTFTEEMKVFRSPGVRDTHVHCAFLVLDPVRLDANIAAVRKNTAMKTGFGNGNSFAGSPQSFPVGGLDEKLDLQVLRALQGKTTVIPVIAKADTITTAHMTVLKRAVWESLRRSKLDPLEAIGIDDGYTEPLNGTNLNEHDDNTMATQVRKRSDVSQLDSPSDSNSSFSASDFDLAKPPRPLATNPSASPILSKDPPPALEIPYLPLSIISPDMYEPDIAGRKFPWGFADPYNSAHCDFLRLKEIVFAEWRGELKEASRNLWYEGWRTSRLNRYAEMADTVGQAR